jgi:hypothetical protein
MVNDLAAEIFSAAFFFEAALRGILPRSFILLPLAMPQV